MSINFRKLESHLGIRIAMFFLLLLLRSHSRLFDPQVWAEDATKTFQGANIPDFLRYGPLAIFRPLNGYLVLLPKLISGFSLSISFLYYPAISTVLAWITIVFVVIVLASDKTRMRGGLLLGGLTLLVPCDPEVFGVPLYTFWWATLLLFALILWRETSIDLKWRVPIVVVAGLSSPLIVGAVPLFLVRAYRLRRVWQEWAVSVLAASCAAIQLIAWITCSVTFPGRKPITAAEVVHAVPTFFGRYLIGNFFHTKEALWIAGLMLASVVVAGIVRSRWNFSHCSIAYLFVITIAMTMRRVPLFDLHPVLAGPRYFFLPFVLISWLVTQLVLGDSGQLLKIAGSTIIVLSVLNAIPVLTREHDDLRWRQNVLSCPNFDRYSIPIEYDGRAYHTWQFRLSGEQCRTLIEHDVFRNVRPLPPTFPYSVFTIDLSQYRPLRAKVGTLRDGEWPISESKNPGLRGIAILGGSNNPTNKRALTLKLRKGQTLLYHVDPPSLHLKVLVNDGKLPFEQWLLPTSDWRFLVFSNALLPDQFSLTFVNQSGMPAMPVFIGLAKDK